MPIALLRELRAYARNHWTVQVARNGGDLLRARELERGIIRRRLRSLREKG